MPCPLDITTTMIFEWQLLFIYSYGNMVVLHMVIVMQCTYWYTLAEMKKVTQAEARVADMLEVTIILFSHMRANEPRKPT